MVRLASSQTTVVTVAGKDGDAVTRYCVSRQTKQTSVLGNSGLFGHPPTIVIRYARQLPSAAGVQAANINQPSYNNCNFAIFRELLPALSGQPINNIPDAARSARKKARLSTSTI